MKKVESTGYRDRDEISLAAEAISELGPEGAAAEIIRRLIEMVHAIRIEQGTEAKHGGVTSRNGYYYKREFKDEAEKFGLEVSLTEKKGWADVWLTEGLAKEIKEEKLLPARFFQMYRVTKPPKNKTIPRRSWACECRGPAGRCRTVSAPAEYDLEARCLACKEAFVLAAEKKETSSQVG